MWVWTVHHFGVCLLVQFVTCTSVVLTSGSLESTAPSGGAENVTKRSGTDDSFFETWLSSPTLQREDAKSPSLSAGDTSPTLKPSKQIQSPSPKEPRSLSSPISPRSVPRTVKPLSSELSTRGSEQQSVEKRPQLQPISVNIADNRQTEQKNVAGMTGLLTTKKTGDSTETRSSEHDNAQISDSVPIFADVGAAALLVSSGNESGRDEDISDVALAADDGTDTSASLGHFNSQMSSSILSPEPDDLLSSDGVDILSSGAGWNDTSCSDIWLSSATDLPDVDGTALPTSKVADDVVDFYSDEPPTSAFKADTSSAENEELTSDIPEDTSCTLSAQVVKDTSSLEASMKEISSLEGSLEASADELSEGNKTVVAEDSDLYCDDTDVDEMQWSGSGRSATVQDHSVPVPSSSEISGFLDNEAQDLDVACELAQMSETPRDGNVEVCETSPPIGSEVKNLLEEAMADNSARDVVDLPRVESGGNSGHTSADEVDTTTSSDIEIISHTSSMNGRAVGSHGSRPLDISPSRSSRVPYGVQHRRSDSGSSAQSIQSRTDDDFASPDADHGRDHLNRLSRDATRRHHAKSEPGRSRHFKPSCNTMLTTPAWYG